ncbi:UDP-N-acetylmuramoyl-tripeptide--D-alanyl-D-alanine ligase [Ralstonia sp. CHL-2022]|uniref:UDP-N-acetylmuramoyl-tripeptide--D-alanyl-D-alanine ligase n=1 Tax=Ralstonia mojiangensis TaxID=2953895 RepID=A0ABT2LCF2_9RALS|nr:UDP-N-acetylmuramoyl-tripeptide--D-alanyl-D-alanine ligase [Ralstonia mojiangensis]MCT7294551.1 UDP-N-acetylmuramoyl-tripeptide--D-alanyl-D-alanine ligase [Ralstonia mojiangensis]MCT7312724.1 UDP-N-acetylmuramoyl-tripeptide--D-alanyl-D-alanine ligase [Ralstonia mojiangensis]
MSAPTVMMHATAAAAWMAGAHLTGPDAAILRVTTDSRAVQPGDLFVALIGERFDAHDFLPEVVARGAAAVLVSRAPAATLDVTKVAVLTVADTRIGLGQLAAGWRRQFPIPVVAVTGSNGKTTVKEMISAIFAQAVGEDARLATAGNFNNDIGLPLTLFRLNAQHKLAVLELGMNHPGETAVLAAIAQPTVAMINNAQREHQEFMVSVEAVAEEHAAVLAALPADGVAVFPRDTANGGEYAPVWQAVAGSRRVLDFGIEAGAVTGTVVDTADGQRIDVQAPGERFVITLPLLGLHNARNALAATACALAAGVAPEVIAQALGNFAPVKGRLQRKHGTHGGLVIDDTYNANPDSMRAAIDALVTLPAPRWLVLGDMGEVGSQGPAFHEEIGAYAREHGIDAVLATGELARHTVDAFGAGAQHFASAEDLIEHGVPAIAPAATVLVKGSRFMRMERIVEALVLKDPGADLPTGSSTQQQH